MPFTFSHPAIVLPLAYLPRRFYSVTGLVIGSLIPDFEYFLRMKIQSDYSHTWLGLVWFDLPLGLIIAFVFHNITRNSLFENSPPKLRTRLCGFKKFNWNQYFKANWHIVIISLLAGTISHFLWDSFTHQHGYFVEILPTLSNKITFAGIQFPIYKLIQHSSTLIGALIIAYSVYQLPQEINNTGRVNYRYWILFTALSVLIITVCLLCGLDFRNYGQFFVTGISGALISLIVVPLILKKKSIL